jgi:arsenate reductase
MFTILLLCTGNATRSIMAEAIFARDGAGRVAAFSAGSNPVGIVPQVTLGCLSGQGLATQGLRSKSWAEFAAPGAPRLDLVLTLCPGVAAEIMPDFPCDPEIRHWRIDDPMAAPLDLREAAHWATLQQLQRRIRAFLAREIETMPRGMAAHHAERVELEA